jgi:cytidylate kinase
MKIRIAISGKSGCGNTTISKIVADTLGLKFINFTFRSLAQEKGLEFKKVLELAEIDDYWDKEIDSRQVKYALEADGCVLGSRLAIWMLKEADLKVYLRASHETRAGRIVMREGESHESISVFTAKRDRRDHERYLRIYGIDNDDYEFADMIIDTDKLAPREIAEMIVSRGKNYENR